MRAILGLLVLGLTALTAGIIGFQAGIASNIGAAGGAVYLGGGASFGFPWFGFLFFAFAGRRRGQWGPYGGGRGYGPWGGEVGPDDPRRQWIADAHRRLHEEEARSASGVNGPANPTGSDPSDPTRPSAG